MRRSVKLMAITAVILLLTVLPVFAGGSREAPELTVETKGSTYISPNGDGVQDSADFEFVVTLYAKAEYVPEYSIKILAADGSAIKEVKETETSGLGWFQSLFTGWKAFTLTKSISWDGTNKDGNLVPEGEYAIVANVVDPDGKNTPVDIPDKFVLDVTPPSLVITPPTDAAGFYLSPEGDGRKDSFTVKISSGTREVVWDGGVFDRTGKKVKTVRLENSAPSDYTWDGTDDNGRVVPNGEYYFSLTGGRTAGSGFEASDLAGNPSPEFRLNGILLHVEQTPVSISIDDPWFSPDGDGQKDWGAGKFSTPVTNGITDWKITVYDGGGNARRSISGETAPPAELWFDGKDDSGAVLRDGTYRVVYAVEYIWGNSVSDTGDFYIDTVDPVVRVSASRLVFSPDYRGESTTAAQQQYDTVRIQMLPPSEPITWKGVIRDSRGKIIHAIDSTITTNLVVWDGRDRGGNPLPDGVYTASAEFTDRAGNMVSGSREITIDTVPPEVTVELDTNVFSPNGDGKLDLLHAKVRANENVNGRFYIKDAAGVVHFDRPGSAGREFSYPWNGTGANGVTLRDGTYQAGSEFRDDAGNWTRTEPLPFVIDTKPPGATVSLSDFLVSPNGDGVRDDLLYNLDADEDVTVVLEMKDQAGKTVYSEEMPLGRVFSLDAAAVLLDKRLPDGTYSIHSRMTDVAMNTATARAVTFTVDTKAPTGSVAVDLDLFSPDGDGVKDQVVLSVKSSEDADVELVIRNVNGADVFRKSAGKNATSIIWNGKQNGKLAPNGYYSLSVILTDAAGNFSETSPAVTYLDGLGAEVTISVEHERFSPNDDGIKDTNTLTITASDYDGLASWSVDVFNEAGKSVFNLKGKDTLPRQLTWDGKTAAGAVPDGYYTVGLQGEYLKGNKVSAKSESIFLDATPPDVSVNVTSNPFAKVEEEAEEIEGEVFISIKVEDVGGVESWELDILNQDNVIVRSYGGNDDPSDQITWNGTSEEGQRARVLDEYTLRLKVSDREGNSTTFEQPISLDILVIRKGDKFYLLVPNIIFGAYQHALDSYSPEQGAENLSSLDRVVDIFERYPAYDLGLEAHALNVLDPVTQTERWQREENILVPLTERRAQSVEAALILKGMPDKKISYEYFGGTQPITDVTDLEVRWKNRRVEFIMLLK